LKRAGGDVSGKYEALTVELRSASGRGEAFVELAFDDVGRLVGGLPPSAVRSRQWWANGSNVQARAWRDAGFRVERVDFVDCRVTFARYASVDTHQPTSSEQRRPTRAGEAVPVAARAAVGEPIDVAVAFQWTDAGHVLVDAGGKPAFGRLDPTPGLYRLTLIDGPAVARPQAYIGETDNLRRRLATNYRTPGASQKTSLRVNALLRAHLAGGGSVALAVATEATVRLRGSEQPLDLSRKAGRLLAESAALVLAHAEDEAEIMNLG
jgi:hypothetical protein